MQAVQTQWRQSRTKVDMAPERLFAFGGSLAFRLVCEGVSIRGIAQASLVEGTVATKTTTWGAAKALYP